MRNVVLALGLLAATTGCTTYLGRPEQWKQPSASMQQLTFDEHRCHEASLSAGRTPDLLVGGILDTARVWIGQTIVSHAYASCMETRGYRRG
ncbi:MAG: hypothetical protein HY294_09120 [Candidatus Rokubacteria bacterium]|nr:hypothetical protein [Candidatus Rokubacteria bacterium]MBI3826146.1 hypothetical protein [Candidatus Rokubacteria bacterium]